MQNDAKLFVTEREAARLISVSPRHLHNLRQQGLVPFARLGRSIRYSPKALAEAVERTTQKAD
jgi:DNA-binding transcriptional MerR regulator